MRVARALACAPLLAIPATALAGEATIRVEGTTQTVFPETAYVLPAPGTSLQIRDTVDGDVMSVGGRTAAAQLGNASRLHGFGFRFTDWGAYGFGLDLIGVDPSDWNTGPAWFLKHNHRLAAVGAGALDLQDGDEVLWALSPLDSSYEMALAELDVVAPTSPMVAGTPFTVRVDSYDNAGTRTPAAGATVTYRGASATAAADGTVRLTAAGTGAATVAATKTGAVRDAVRTCAHPADDPTACDLPPLPRAAMPGDPRGDEAAAARETIRVPVTIRTAAGEVTISAAVPLPAAGAPPVAIRRTMISGADLTPAEMRRAQGTVASAVAAHLNARASRGEGAFTLPAGVRWQPSWLSGTPYLVPLRQGEAMLGVRSGGPLNTAATRTRVGHLDHHLRRCGLRGDAALARRHGYAIALITPAAVRDPLVQCVTGTA